MHKIQIATATKFPVFAEAYRVKNTTLFAIHRPLSDAKVDEHGIKADLVWEDTSWNITHVPSGRAMIQRIATISEARAIGKRMVQLLADAREIGVPDLSDILEDPNPAQKAQQRGQTSLLMAYGRAVSTLRDLGASLDTYAMAWAHLSEALIVQKLLKEGRDAQVWRKE